jgi:hypothetical protein
MPEVRTLTAGEIIQLQRTIIAVSKFNSLLLSGILTSCQVTDLYKLKWTTSWKQTLVHKRTIKIELYSDDESHRSTNAYSSCIASYGARRVPV